MARAPVIVLSSLTETDKQMEGFLAGCVDYITKDTLPYGKSGVFIHFAVELSFVFKRFCVGWGKIRYEISRDGALSIFLGQMEIRKKNRPFLTEKE